MQYVLSLAVLLVCSMHVAACDLDALQVRLERAMEPLSHSYIYEDIDDIEMVTELERHVLRLKNLIASPPDGCRDHPGGSALLSYAERLRVHALGEIINSQTSLRAAIDQRLPHLEGAR